MKKLIIASFVLAGFSFASNAQTSGITTAARTTSPVIAKHPAKMSTQANTITPKSTTVAAAVAGKKPVAHKAAVKTKKPVATHKKHKARKKLAKKTAKGKTNKAMKN